MDPWVFRICVVSGINARVKPRSQGEDSQAEASVGVCHIVADISKRISHWTYIKSSGWSIRTGFDLVPNTVEITTSCMVVHHIIGWVGDPEGCNRCVSLQHVCGRY